MVAAVALKASARPPVRFVRPLDVSVGLYDKLKIRDSATKRRTIDMLIDAIKPVLPPVLVLTKLSCTASVD